MPSEFAAFTSRIALTLDFGILYWLVPLIKDFKYGFAALPRAKTNENLNYNDFWIMGRWSTNKDAAWRVMRILTSVEATTKYSEQSGTPPTPRESLDPWLRALSSNSGQSVPDLRKLTTGAIEKKRSQESPDHLFLQYPKICDTYRQEISPLWINKGTAQEIVPAVGKRMDEIALGIYNQFKDSLPKD